ncbi:MAG: hypothetical protein ABIA59_07230 [Candidatus Latescibacterota bacterium]
MTSTAQKRHSILAHPTWATNPLRGTSEDQSPKAISRAKWAEVRSAYRMGSANTLCGAILISCLLCLAAAIPARAMTPLGVVVETTVDTDSVTVGERFHVRYHIDYPESLAFHPPAAVDAGTCRFVSKRFGGGEVLAGRVKRTAEFELYTLDLSEARLPGMELHFLTPAGDTLTVIADEVAVPVRALASAGGDIKPLKDPWKAPADYRRFVIAAIIAAAAAAVIYLLWRKRKRRVGEKEPATALPPDFIALRELRRIENMNLVQAGEFKKYYTLVADAIRNYIEKRFGVDAMDRTTNEVLGDLARIRKRIDNLESFLQEADLVKFAKFVPDASTAAAAMRTACDVVARTSRRELTELAAKTQAGSVAGAPDSSP